MIKRLVLMSIVLAALIGAMVYFNYVLKPAGIAAYFASHPQPLPPVAVVEAELNDVPKALIGIGTVVAVHQVTVAPEIGGRVMQIYFTPGSTVKQADPLVQLNDGPERGDLANYQAQARNAEQQLKRSKELVGRQFTPQATVDQNQATLDVANALIAKTEAQIAQKLIRAPFDGELGIRQVDLGQYVTPGGPIVTLTNLDKLYVNFTLPEQERARLQVGQAVSVTVDAYPGKTFDAKLTTIEPQIGTDTRTIKLQATLDNPGHLLLPGMFANASVGLPSEANVVTVPETAIDYSLYGDSVFVVKEEGTDAQGKPVTKATRVPVKTGTRFNNRVAVLSGLQAGDKVAASGQLRLSSGMPVTVIPADTLSTPAHLPVN